MYRPAPVLMMPLHRNNLMPSFRTASMPSFRTVFVRNLLLPLTLLLNLAANSNAADIPKISEFIVRGNKEISDEAIIKASRLKLGEEVSPTEIEEAKRWITMTGNFGVHLPNPNDGVQVSYDVHEGKAVVNIKVVENPIIKAIAVSGSGPIPPADILAAIQTKKMSVLNLPRVQNDVQVIQHLYDVRGYQAFVEEDIGMREGTLNIPIRIGKVISISFKGLSRVKEKDVRKRMKLKVGDFYNINEMKKDLTNLMNTKKFDQIEPVFSFPAPGEMDLVLNCKEKPR